MKLKLSAVMVNLLLGIGLLVLFYPIISQRYNQKFQMQAVVSYDENISELTAQALEEERTKAQEYNHALIGEGIEDPFIPGSGTVLPEDYLAVLDIYDGIMGYIDIPIIDVHLPIYHGTREEILKKGIGHMEMTAFPIGGADNHAVLTGHTGLTEAILFSNLDQMDIGDVFYIHILNEILAYAVDSILVIEPTDTEALKPVENEDYITLITCTPYAVNSHRLLVRGTRVTYSKEAEKEAGQNKKTAVSFNLIIANIVLVLVCISRIRLIYKKRRLKKKSDVYMNKR